MTSSAMAPSARSPARQLRDPKLMARFAAYFYGCGGTLVLASLVLPHARPVFAAGIVAPALIAYAVVLVLIRWGGRLPYWCFRLVPIGGSSLISIVAWSGRGGAPAYAFLYVWAALYAFYFLGRTDAIIQVVLIAFAYGAVLALSGQVMDAEVDWLMALGTIAVAAMWVRTVVRRLREHAEMLQSAGEEVLGGEARLRELILELESSNRDLEQFAYVSAHDLQEPLRMVASYVQLLERRYRGRLDQDADEYIAFAVEGASRMQALIIDLLSFSRVGRRPEGPVDVDTGDCVRSAVMNLRASIETNRAAIVYAELPRVSANPGDVVQVFQNLIGNAVKFHADRTPRVEISAEPAARAGWLTFSVRDNGIGIDPLHAERIFAIFQRLNRRERFEGTGIGLAICRKVVEQHGGTIWVESTPGHGSAFRFTLRGTTEAAAKIVSPEPAAGDRLAEAADAGRAVAALSELVAVPPRRL